MRVQPVHNAATSTIPDGRHVFRITGASQAVRKVKPGDKGPPIPYVKWLITVAKGEAEGANTSFNTPIGGEHVWILDALLLALNADYKIGDEFDTDDYEGLLFEATLKNEIWDGKPSLFPNIKDVNAYVDVEAEPEYSPEDIPF